MIELKKVGVLGKEAEGVKIDTGKTVALIIKAEKGFLACGYFDINVANKVGDVAAIVTGVKDFEDMLNAKLVAVSKEAKKLGITGDMTGKDALALMS
jgi:uncharacterized protein YunC (DUF1805 family)